MKREAFPLFHKADRNALLVFLAIAWIVILFGFGPGIIARFEGRAEYPAPLALQVHVFAFVGWMALLTLQAWLIRTRRRYWHRMLGLSAAGLIPLMLVSGAMAEIHAERYYGAKSPGEEAFLIFNIYALPAFAILATWALLARAQAAAHKRLILLATCVILAAAFNRLTWDILVPLSGDAGWGVPLNVFLGSNLLILALMAYDMATRGRLHPVYARTVPVMFCAQLAAAWIYQSPAWAVLVRQWLGLS